MYRSDTSDWYNDRQKVHNLIFFLSLLDSRSNRTNFIQQTFNIRKSTDENKFFKNFFSQHSSLTRLHF